MAAQSALPQLEANGQLLRDLKLGQRTALDCWRNNISSAARRRNDDRVIIGTCWFKGARARLCLMGFPHRAAGRST